MAVNQNRAAPFSMLIARPNDRMTRGRNQFRLQSDAVQFLNQPMRAFGELVRIIFVRGNAGKSQKRIEIFKMTGTHGSKANQFSRICLRLLLQLSGSDDCYASLDGARFTNTAKPRPIIAPINSPAKIRFKEVSASGITILFELTKFASAATRSSSGACFPISDGRNRNATNPPITPPLIEYSSVLFS